MMLLWIAGHLLRHWRLDSARSILVPADARILIEAWLEAERRRTDLAESKGQQRRK